MQITNNKSVRHLLLSIVGTKKYAFIINLIQVVRHPVATAMNMCSFGKIKKNQVWAEIHSSDLWIKLFKKMIIFNPDKAEVVKELINHFIYNELKLIKNAETNSSKKTIVVCTIKNDVTRVKELIPYYRKMGVEHFLFIDNGSDDGTEEYLLEQRDVSLYRTEEKYSAIKKTAWMNRVIAANGLNRWYLIIDSDEFFVYPEMDSLGLDEYASELLKKGKAYVKTLLLEMYPQYGICDSSKQDKDFIYEYVFFDRDSDWYYQDAVNGKIFGGLHWRCFDSKYTLRSKIPLLFYDGTRMVRNSHEIVPSFENISNTIGGALLHYKWLPSEREKIKEIAKEGNYYNGSVMYKRYSKRINEDSSLLFEGSVEWKGTESFKYLPFIIKETCERV